MKLEDIRKMTDDELKNYLTDLRKELFNIRTRNVTDVEEKPDRIQKAKKEIARILTVLNEKKKTNNSQVRTDIPQTTTSQQTELPKG